VTDPVDTTTADEPQVSWKAIEEGAEVVWSDGKVEGHMTRVVGDPDADVFSGLAIRSGPLSKERYIEAERVRAIWARRVEVDLPSSAFDELPEYEDVPVVHVRPDDGGFFRRLFGGGRGRT
jgi:hypothetical protein